MAGIAKALRLSLEAISLLLLTALLLIVVVAVGARYTGHMFLWYDEVASILLAWLTYFGAALAALKRGHLGFDNAMRALPPAARRAAFVLAEAVTIGFFIALGWGGWALLDVLAGETLVSLPSVPSSVVQAAIPIGATLFVLAELLSMQEAWRRYGQDAALEEGHL
ncbi:MAG: TRAP transporter small permease subunit [Alphaproteobacteria bacterium]|nr:TRAP transporter small permease subunit [Alphaproteobacteria bacterium]